MKHSGHGKSDLHRLCPGLCYEIDVTRLFELCFSILFGVVSCLFGVFVQKNEELNNLRVAFGEIV